MLLLLLLLLIVSRVNSVRWLLPLPLSTSLSTRDVSDDDDDDDIDDVRCPPLPPPLLPALVSCPICTGTATPPDINASPPDDADTMAATPSSVPCTSIVAGLGLGPPPPPTGTPVEGWVVSVGIIPTEAGRVDDDVDTVVVDDDGGGTEDVIVPSVVKLLS